MDIDYIEVATQLDLPTITKLSILRKCFEKLHLLDGEYKIQCYLDVFEYDVVTEDTINDFQDADALIDIFYRLSPCIIAPLRRRPPLRTYQLACKAKNPEESFYKHLQALGTRKRKFATMKQLIDTAQNDYHYTIPKSVLDCMYTENITSKAVWDLRNTVPSNSWSYNCDLQLWMKEANVK